MNWLASKHNLKMAGRSFGWKKNYGLTVTVSSEPWCRADSAKEQGGRKALTSKKDSIAQSIGAVPRQVQQIMNSFERTQQKLNDEKMILRCEEHLRQAVQLKYAWYVLFGSPYCWCSSLMTLIPSFNFSRHYSEDEHLRAKIE